MDFSMVEHKMSTLKTELAANIANYSQKHPKCHETVTFFIIFHQTASPIGNHSIRSIAYSAFYLRTQHGCGSYAKDSTKRTSYTEGGLCTSGNIVAYSRRTNAKLMSELLLSYSFFLYRKTYKLPDSRFCDRIVDFFVCFYHIRYNREFNCFWIIDCCLVSNKR